VRDGTGGAQSVLVLGGASDIAVATVRRLVADRCRRVVLAGRPSAALDAAAATVRADGAEVEVVAFDAVEVEAHEKVVGEVFAGGDIDVVILAFGVLGDQAAFDEDHASAVDAVTVNYTGAVSAGLAVADRLRAQGHGTLARTTTSTARPRPGSTPSPRAWATPCGGPAPASWSSGPASSPAR
jgi:decaprenylphospho-beta-D-erythro-pentofuranosid-2-ulose 2-reductase